MKAKVNIITLGVNDIKLSTQFYEKGLGWKKSAASSDAIVFFQLSGSLVLALYPRQLLAEDATVPFTETGFPGITLAYNAENENEVDEILKLAGSVGGKILKPGQKVFWGGYSGYFSDPDGTLWEVAYNPFFPLDEKGLVQLPE